MLRFDVMPDNIMGFVGSMDGYTQTLRSIGGDVEYVRRRLEFSDDLQRKMGYNLQFITRSAYQESSGCASMSSGLANVVLNYQKTEERISDNAKIAWTGIAERHGSEFSSNRMSGGGGGELGGRGDSRSAEDNAGKRLLEIVNALLGLTSKTGNNSSRKKGSAAAKSLISYICSLYDFYTGDKKGVTGAVDLMDVASDSAGFWESLYKFAKVKYKEQIDLGKGVGLFSDKGQKGVGCISFAGDVTGLISKLIDATVKEYDNWWETVGEYLGIGGNLFKTGQSGKDLWNLFHGVKPEISKGLYSPAALWGIFADTCFSTFSQVFTSIGEYSADGKWTTDDTAATLVDTSVSGLYAIIKGLSFGTVSEKTTGISAQDISDYLQNWAKEKGRDIGEFILVMQGR